MKNLLLSGIVLSLLGAGCAAPVSSRLDLKSQGLEKLPATIFEDSNLIEVDVSYNNLRGALPSEIGKLTKLKRLNASHNQMTGLPAEIGRLQALEELDISSNQITGLPLELKNLTQLKVLDISGNPYSRTDLSQIEQALPNTQIRK